MRMRTKNTAQNDNSVANGINAVATALRPREVPTTMRGPNN